VNPTYLEHPQHGRMVVYNDAKLDRSLKTGWKISEHQPDGGRKPLVAAPVKKPGRPKKA
jgi:hypothetical protein